jgi:hypothetical protein
MSQGEKRRLQQQVTIVDADPDQARQRTYDHKRDELNIQMERVHTSFQVIVKYAMSLFICLLVFVAVLTAIFGNLHTFLSTSSAFMQIILNWFIPAVLVSVGMYLFSKLYRALRNHQLENLTMERIKTEIRGMNDENVRANKMLDAEVKLKESEAEKNYAIAAITRTALDLDHQGNKLVRNPVTGIFELYQGNMREHPGLTSYSNHLANTGLNKPGQEVPQLKPGKPLAILPPGDLPDGFDLLKVFKAGVTPDRTFLGMLDGGEQFYIDAHKKLCHGAINAITGRGKTIIKRGIEAQLLFFDFEVFDLDPKFTLIDEEGLDYRPFAQKLLAQSPVEVERNVLMNHLEVDVQRISQFLKWLATVEVPRRLDLYHRGIHNYKTLYAFIEEMLYLVAKCPEVAEYLVEILPVARSLGIKVFVCAQNFQVQSIQLPGGMRENFETAWYPGGDDLSGAKLLDVLPSDLTKWMSQYNIALGKGISMIRNNFLSEKPRLMRVGMASNEAVYYLLGKADTFTFPANHSLGTANTTPGTHYRGGTTKITVESQPATVDASVPSHGYPVYKNTGPLSTPSEMAVNEPEKRVPTVGTASPDGEFVPGPGYRTFTPEQVQEFITRYRKNPGQNIKDYLRQMNGGQGLGNSYAQHGSWLVEKYGLRK